MTDNNILIAKAKEYLKIGKTDIVIGYTVRTNVKQASPMFAYSSEQADEFVLDKRCEYNLSAYLVKEKISDKHRKIGIFLNPSGIRTINVLVSEEQIDPNKIVIFGFDIKNDDNIEILSGETIDDFSELLAKFQDMPMPKCYSDEISEMESLDSDERFEYWREQFSKCIKCYACRQACPMCYCSRCIVDCNQPQWICTSAHTLGNFEWNIVRAFHLAGRCVECGNCQRVCPVEIPLMKINRKLAKEVADRFGYVAGLTRNQEPVLASFRQEDPEEFIL